MNDSKNTMAVLESGKTVLLPEAYRNKVALRVHEQPAPCLKETVFSQRLSEMIVKRGLTRKCVAEMTGTTEATISRYCNAVRAPQVLDTLTRLTEVLDVSADYLLGTSDVRERETSRSAEEQILLDIWPEITQADRRVMLAVLDKYMTRAQKEQIRKNRY